MAKPNDFIIIAPIDKNGNIKGPFLKEKKSWLWKLFEKLGWLLVGFIYFAICAFGVLIYWQAY